MNYCLALFMFLSIVTGVLQRKASVPPDRIHSLTQEPMDLVRFKAFVKSYFAAIASKDTIFLKNHTEFPIRDSDFGFYIRAGKRLSRIDATYYFRHLNIFFHSDEITAAQKKGEYRKALHEDNEYYLRLERPLKSNPDYLETYTWFFEKKENDFFFSTFKYESN